MKKEAINKRHSFEIIKNGRIILILLGIIGTVLTIFYFFQIRNRVQTIPPDWKTYTNLRYGYVVKYPPDWKIIEWGVGPQKTASSDSYDIAIVSPTKSGNCANNPGVLVIEKTMDAHLSLMYLSYPNDINPKNTSIYIDYFKKLPAIETTDYYCVEKIKTKSVFKNSNDNQGIIFEMNDTPQKDYNNTFTKILSTFKINN